MEGKWKTEVEQSLGSRGLVTGDICRRLNLRNHPRERIHDSLWSRNATRGPLDNVMQLEINPNVDFIKCDLDFSKHDIVNPSGIEVDESLACPASPVHYQAGPVGTTKITVLGDLNMLDLARWSGARILQASTSDVCGDPDVHPQAEEYRGSVDPTGPRACYDEPDDRPGCHARSRPRRARCRALVGAGGVVRPRQRQLGRRAAHRAPAAGIAAGNRPAPPPDRRGRRHGAGSATAAATAPRSSRRSRRDS